MTKRWWGRRMKRMAIFNISLVHQVTVGKKNTMTETNVAANGSLVLWMTSIGLHSYNDGVQKEGGGGGTHILYVRYIILLQNGRQAEQRKEEITQVERWRVRTGWKQAARHLHKEVGFTDTVDRIKPIFLSNNLSICESNPTCIDSVKQDKRRRTDK